MVASTLQELEENDGWLDHKTLERRRGFLLYVTRTYPAMVLYLKGMHLTLDGWRKGRDDEGWKALGREAREAEDAGEDTGKDEDMDCPKRIKGKPRFLRDMRSLLDLFSAPSPPEATNTEQTLV
jgi:hypothetical protein